MKFLLRRPTYATVVLIVLTFASLVSLVAFLRFETDIARILPTDSPQRDDLVSFADDFPTLANEGIVAVTAPDLADALAALDGAILELLFSDGVGGVNSIFSVPAPGTTSPYLQQPEIAELTDAEKLDGLWQDSTLARYLVSEDRTITAINIRWDPAATDADKQAALDLFGSMLPATVELTTLGRGAIERHIVGVLQADQTRLIITSTLICIVVAYLLLGSFKAVAVIVVPSLVGVAWSLGAIGLLGIPLDPLLMIVPTLLLVLGVADAMHFGFAMAGRAVSQPIETAISDAFRDTFPAAAVTSVTTIVAFLAMFVAAGEPFLNLAIFGTIGLLLQLAAVSAGVSLMYLLLKPDFRDKRFETLTFLVALVPTRYRTVAIAITVAAFALAALAPYPGTAHDPTEQLPNGSAYTKTIFAADEKLGGADRLFLVFAAANPEKGVQNEDSQRLSAVVATAFSEPRFRETFDTDAPQSLQFLESADGSRFALPVPVRYAQPSDALLDRAAALLDDVSALDMPPPTLVGESLAVGREIPSLLDDINQSFFLTVIAIGLFAFVILRSVKNALLFMFPNLLTLIIVAVGFGMLGSALTMTGALALTIAFGISVDDTVHFWNRYRINRRGASGDALGQTIEEVVPPIFSTTVLIACGFIALWMSDIPALAQSGIVLATAACTAMVCDLFMLPSFLKGSRSG